MVEYLEGKNNENKSKAWYVIPALGLITIAIIAYFFMYRTPIKNSMTSTTTTTIITEEHYYIATNQAIFDKQIKDSDSVNLNAGRYSLSFSSDSDVTILFGKDSFVICNDSPNKFGTCNFDVNNGAEGEYILKVSGGSQIADVKISQSLAF